MKPDGRTVCRASLHASCPTTKVGLHLYDSLPMLLYRAEEHTCCFSAAAVACRCLFLHDEHATSGAHSCVCYPEYLHIIQQQYNMLQCLHMLLYPPPCPLHLPPPGAGHQVHLHQVDPQAGAVPGLQPAGDSRPLRGRLRGMPVSTAPAGGVVPPALVPGSLAGWQHNCKEGHMWWLYPASMGILPSPTALHSSFPWLAADPADALVLLNTLCGACGSSPTPVPHNPCGVACGAGGWRRRGAVTARPPSCWGPAGAAEPAARTASPAHRQMSCACVATCAACGSSDKSRGRSSRESCRCSWLVRGSHSSLNSRKANNKSCKSLEAGCESSCSYGLCSFRKQAPALSQ